MTDATCKPREELYELLYSCTFDIGYLIFYPGIELIILAMLYNLGCRVKTAHWLHLELTQMVVK